MSFGFQVHSFPTRLAQNVKRDSISRNFARSPIESPSLRLPGTFIRFHYQKQQPISCILKSSLSILAVLGLAAAMIDSGFAESYSHKALYAPNKEYPYFDATHLSTERDAGEFDLERARFLAEASLLAYVKETEFIEAKLKKAGFPETRFYAHKGTFAFLAIRDSGLVLCFRGSESANMPDFTTDTKIIQAPFKDYGTAHSGFIEALEWVSDSIDADVSQLLEENPCPVWATGHSLGAALAVLYGIHQHEQVSAVYTMGAPRVGGIKFAKNVEKLVPMFRLINDNDIIPRLPTPPFYKHFGSIYFITSENELITDPPFAKLWESRRKGHASLIESLYKQHWKQGDFSGIPIDYLVDHSPRLYAEALLAASEKD